MSTIKNNLCIIPARGGSKRILRKNIKNFLGKPIIAYSIEAALKSGLFSEVMVSTDDKEIADVALEYGAKIPFFRSEKNSDDFATTIDVLREVVSEYEKLGQVFPNLCCIYATAPFVSSEKIEQAYYKLVKCNYDSILPVMKFSYPLQRSFKMREGSRIEYNYPRFKSMRSQDLETAYHDAGQFYWMKKELLNTESIITENTGAVVISELEGQDIDDETDWKLAELKYELLQSLK